MFYQPIPHTADIAFKVWGKTREELFANAARALTDCMVETCDGVATQTVFVQLEAESFEELLVKWLSEVLYSFETQELVGLGFTVSCCELKLFKASIHGVKWEPAKQPLKTQIKAVTFHELKIEKNADRYEVQVILDV